jgi:hypothetical protein
MMIRSWLVFALLAAVGFPLAAQAGGQCGGHGCSISNNPAGSPLAGRSQIAPQAQGGPSTVDAVSGQGNPGIVPINARVTTVKTYAELGAEWWQWAVQAPATDNPLTDATGEKCRVGQQGPVWFLAGTQGSGVPTQRTCEVPFGKAIFFPVINVAWFAFLSDPPEERTGEFVRAKAEAACDSNSIGGLSVKIDGTAVARPAQFVTFAKDSPLFQAQLPSDNIFGATPTDIPELLLSPSAHKGFYLYLRPLAPGSHTISWTATWDCDFGNGPITFSERVSYTLNVLSGVSNEVK